MLRATQARKAGFLPHQPSIRIERALQVENTQPPDRPAPPARRRPTSSRGSKGGLVSEPEEASKVVCLAMHAPPEPGVAV